MTIEYQTNQSLTLKWVPSPIIPLVEKNTSDSSTAAVKFHRRSTRIYAKFYDFMHVRLSHWNTLSHSLYSVVLHTNTKERQKHLCKPIFRRKRNEI